MESKTSKLFTLQVTGTNMKIVFWRCQKVEAPLLRVPDEEEIDILKGNDDSVSMFDLNIVDFDKEEVVDEDYTFETFIKLERPKIENT